MTGYRLTAFLHQGSNMNKKVQHGMLLLCVCYLLQKKKESHSKNPTRETIRQVHEVSVPEALRNATRQDPTDPGTPGRTEVSSRLSPWDNLEQKSGESRARPGVWWWSDTVRMPHIGTVSSFSTR